jgi:hypothetical protein
VLTAGADTVVRLAWNQEQRRSAGDVGDSELRASRVFDQRQHSTGSSSMLGDSLKECGTFDSDEYIEAFD